MRSQLPSHLKQQVRTVVEVIEQDQDRRMGFGGIDGALCSVRCIWAERRQSRHLREGASFLVRRDLQLIFLVVSLNGTFANFDLAFRFLIYNIHSIPEEL